MEEANVHLAQTTATSYPHNAPATQNELLQSRFELVYLIFQFLISLAVLLGVFMLIVVFPNEAVVSGGVALAAVVVTYWFGLGSKRTH